MGGNRREAGHPIPENVRRYYIPSTSSRWRPRRFRSRPPRTPVVDCPGNNWGQGTLRANPVPHTETVNAIRVHFRDWVMNGTLPPPSLYPTLRGTPKIAREDDRGEDDDRDAIDDDRDDWNDRHHGKPRGFLVEPTKEAMGFPDGIPELPPSVPEAATITSLDGVPLASPIREVPFINPVLDYTWGPFFDPSDGSGVPTNQPPPINR